MAGTWNVCNFNDCGILGEKKHVFVPRYPKTLPILSPMFETTENPAKPKEVDQAEKLHPHEIIENTFTLWL